MMRQPRNDDSSESSHARTIAQRGGIGIMSPYSIPIPFRYSPAVGSEPKVKQDSRRVREQEHEIKGFYRPEERTTLPSH
jgi:hypothetical protein